ncbi:hypothetical protein WICPIJ_002990 [Wickerhamomyces pijperi]|uniref:Uncharacterized protein n=1 Tax=Wickerhamomyces pijperi TaxID=599730 RepID=A0A9P8Q8N1_WICPI|nr:hypothetical protein WICPIJ_002990 [Wickerhamomyces pijperi]
MKNPALTVLVQPTPMCSISVRTIAAPTAEKQKRMNRGDDTSKDKVLVLETVEDLERIVLDLLFLLFLRLSHGFTDEAKDQNQVGQDKKTLNPENPSPTGVCSDDTTNDRADGDTDLGT